MKMSARQPGPVQTLSDQGSRAPVDRRQGIRRIAKVFCRMTERDDETNGAAKRDPTQKQWMVVVEYPPSSTAANFVTRPPFRDGRPERLSDQLLVQAHRRTEIRRMDRQEHRQLHGRCPERRSQIAPRISNRRSSIQGEISGKFTKNTAEDLALTLKSGALPADYRISGRAHRRPEPRCRFDPAGVDSFDRRPGIRHCVHALLLSRRGNQCRGRADPEHDPDDRAP